MKALLVRQWRNPEVDKRPAWCQWFDRQAKRVVNYMNRQKTEPVALVAYPQGHAHEGDIVREVVMLWIAFGKESEVQTWRVNAYHDGYHTDERGVQTNYIRRHLEPVGKQLQGGHFSPKRVYQRMIEAHTKKEMVKEVRRTYPPARDFWSNHVCRAPHLPSALRVHWIDR